MKTGDTEVNFGAEWPASPEDVLYRLEDIEIAMVTHDHPHLFTVEYSKALKGPLPWEALQKPFFKKCGY